MKNFSLIALGFVGAFLLGFGLVFGILGGSSYFAEKIQEDKVASVDDLNDEISVELQKGGPAPEELAPVELIPDVPNDDAVKKYVLADDAKPFPKVVSESFLVADLDTGDIIASRDPLTVYPIASLTKLMTAIVAEETYKTGDETKVSRTAYNTYGAQGRLGVGETYTILELLYPLLLESSNDAAEVLAEHGGREVFMSDMNAKSESLGLIATHFEDPSGLSAGNISTAKDLFKLVQYTHKFRNYIFDITKEKKHKERGKTWYNNSRFRNDQNYIGGKNGYTDEAQKTLIANFQLPLEGESSFRNISIILLNSGDTTTDVRKITEFLHRYVYYQ